MRSPNGVFNNYIMVRADDRDNPLEELPWCLFDTDIVRNGQAGPLRFFDKPFQGSIRSNNWMIGMLPNPMSMLIKRIQIYGIASDMALSRFKLQIGNKIMVERPSWTCAVRQGMDCGSGLCILPLQAYRAEIDWEGGMCLGKGLSGKPIDARAVQVALIGTVVRAAF